MGGLLKSKADLEARKEPQIVLVHRPARQRSGLEPVGQLRIGLNGIECVMRSGDDDRDLQFVAQKLDDVLRKERWRSVGPASTW
jgi:hypothetical protein